MKKSTKAALLSGLVLPGSGHLIFRKYVRAGALVIASVASIYVIVSISVRQAMLVVDRIVAGEVPMDSATITNLVAATSTTADNTRVNLAVLAFGLAWLIGIVDAWRLGAAEDKRDAQA
jgi:hypothetical protein